MQRFFMHGDSALGTLAASTGEGRTRRSESDSTETDRWFMNAIAILPSNLCNRLVPLFCRCAYTFLSSERRCTVVHSIWSMTETRNW